MARDLGFEAAKQEKGYFFLSYNSDSAEKIAPVAQALHENGLDIWYDNGLIPSEKWEWEIAVKIQNCRALVLLFTKEIFLKPDPYTKKEYRLAELYDKKIYVVFPERISKNEITVENAMWYVEMREQQVIEIDEAEATSPKRIANRIRAEIAKAEGVRFSAADSRLKGKQHRLVVITGVLGTGKTNIARHASKLISGAYLAHEQATIACFLTQDYNELQAREERSWRLEYDVNSVSRRDFHSTPYVDEREFDLLCDAGVLINISEFGGVRYGTRLLLVEEALLMGNTVFLVTDTDCAYELRQQLPACTLVYIEMPSEEELMRRLLNHYDVEEGFAKRKVTSAKNANQLFHERFADDDTVLYLNNVVGSDICAQQLVSYVRQRCGET